MVYDTLQMFMQWLTAKVMSSFLYPMTRMMSWAGEISGAISEFYMTKWILYTMFRSNAVQGEFHTDDDLLWLNRTSAPPPLRRQKPLLTDQQNQSTYYSVDVSYPE